MSPREEAEKRKAAKVCRHADPRCIDDPCPYGIWRVLCQPTVRQYLQESER